MQALMASSLDPTGFDRKKSLQEAFREAFKTNL